MQSAKIIASKGKSVELKELEGIFSCLLEHKVAETSAQFEYTGPKISPECWDQVLRFFKWSYFDSKSEAQVRLFVHPEHGWMAHAFPQKGGTGMTTKEIESEDAKTQRAAIPAGYTAFGTVHHHCSMSAFQSGVDQEDESSVDGLHITVGNVDKEQMDLHCRIYVKGNKFEPNLAAFWDIGGEMLPFVELIKSLAFSEDQVADKIARRQMGKSPPVITGTEIGFPQQWKENYILPARSAHSWDWQSGQHDGWEKLPNGCWVRKKEEEAKRPANGTTVWCYHCKSMVGDHFSDNCPKGADIRSGRKNKKNKKKYHEGTTFGALVNEAEAVEEFLVRMKLRGYTDEDALLGFLEGLGSDEEAHEVIMQIAWTHNFKIKDIATEAYKEMKARDDEELEAAAQEALAAAGLEGKDDTESQVAEAKEGTALSPVEQAQLAGMMNAADYD